MKELKEAIEQAKKFSMGVDVHGQVFEYNYPELLHIFSLVAEKQRDADEKALLNGDPYTAGWAKIRENKLITDQLKEQR